MFRFTLLFSVVFLGISAKNSHDCGKLSPEKPFPWNVAIYVEETNKPLELICFGTIIKSNAILTAAHCFFDNIDGSLRNANFYVSMGKQQFKKHIPNDKKEENALQQIEKKHVIRNAEYKGHLNFFSGDLSIVKVQKIQFNSTISPVCIDWSNSLNSNFKGVSQSIWTEATVKKIQRVVIDLQDCISEIPTEHLHYITADKSCVNNQESHHLSAVDEGAGLMLLNPLDHRWYIIGVTSKHEPSQGEFSTFTTITQYMNWLANTCAAL